MRPMSGPEKVAQSNQATAEQQEANSPNHRLETHDASGSDTREGSSPLASSVNEEWKQGKIAPIFRRGKLFGAKHGIQQLVQSRVPDYCASNPPKSLRGREETSIYIHGIVPNPAYCQPTALRLVETLGVGMPGILDDQERSILGDIHHANAGIYSATLGRLVEPSAVNTLIGEIRDAHERGVDVRLVPHSKGCVTSSNALQLYRDSLDAETWADRSKGIRVEAYGAAKHEWPADIHVIEYRMSKDAVSVSTQLIDGSRSKVVRAISELFAPAGKGIDALAALSGRQEKNTPDKAMRAPELVSLKIPARNQHSLVTYLEHQSDFFISRFMEDGKLNSFEAAKELHASISRGEYSKYVHDSIVNKLSTDPLFSRTFLTLVGPGGGVGNYRLHPVLVGRMRARAQDLLYAELPKSKMY